MICIISLVIFTILGIFSARYRSLAREAFDCVFKRMRLKPCESGLDQRVKSKIVGRVFKKNKRLAGILSKYFEVFSWSLVILMIISFGFAANGLFNYYQYGNCNGPQSTASCSLQTIETGFFEKIKVKIENFLNPTSIEDISYKDNPWTGAEDPELRIFEFGCLKCPYTARIQPEINKLVSEYNGSVRVYFMHFPLSGHDNSMKLAIASECAQRQGKFWEFKEETFKEIRSCSPQKTDISDEIINIAERSELDIEQFKSCLKKNKESKLVEGNRVDGIMLGVKKTPTLFIEGKKVVGYKSYEELEDIVKGKLRG